MELNDVLAIALKGGASDIHLKAGMPAIVPRQRPLWCR
jgi:Tfp pilus assembly pilus retraction ATPase PilT